MPRDRHRSANRRDPAPFPRTARVNQVLREVVADELERLADVDERLRLATVTAVQTSPDLRQAYVYMSSMSEDSEEALAEFRVQIQGSIGRQMRIKRTPALTFMADPAVASGLRVEEILGNLHRERPDAGRPSTGGPSTGGPSTGGPGTDAQDGDVI